MGARGIKSLARGCGGINPPQLLCFPKAGDGVFLGGDAGGDEPCEHGEDDADADHHHDVPPFDIEQPADVQAVLHDEVDGHEEHGGDEDAHDACGEAYHRGLRVSENLLAKDTQKMLALFSSGCYNAMAVGAWLSW